MASRIPTLGLLLLLPLLVVPLNNGLGLTPAMGWSSWYAAPDGSQVTSAFVRNQTLAMVTRGLAAKGYVYSNVDEGWLKGRYANGSLYEDLDKFPETMAALGEWVHSLETSPGSGKYMKYGLYTCRGTCQCSTDKYSGPGGQGYEAQDSAWMVASGADWLKVDSWCVIQPEGFVAAPQKDKGLPPPSLGVDLSLTLSHPLSQPFPVLQLRGTCLRSASVE
jgi:alpha-galactosidase